MKKCVICNKVIQGRADKIYCSDKCRSLYHNRDQKIQRAYIKKVNTTLKRNREFLAKYYLLGKGKITKAILYKDGFKFGYYTGRYETQQGHLYYYCYDYGYCILGKDKVLIVKLQPYVQNYLDSVM